MEQFGARIRYGGAYAALMRKSDWNRQVETPTWRAPGVLWIRQFRPKHFTVAGAVEYQYSPRKGQDLPRNTREFWKSYFGQKLQKKKHARPLVFSGELERETKRGSVHPTSKGMKVKMRARKANWRHPNSEIDMASEVRRVAPGEARKMVREKERAMTKKLREVRTVIQKTVGGI